MSKVNGQILNTPFVFFGTPEVSVEILEILKKENLIPSLVVTAPDRPKGRGMKLTPPPVKVAAERYQIPVIQPATLTISNLETLISKQFQNSKFKIQNWQPKLFLVVAYGKILPKEILEIPEKGVLNLHYSLLPKLRGSSPVETAILENENPTGTTVMLVDEKMDHGPILAQKEVCFDPWPIPKNEVFQKLNQEGGELLAKTIPQWIDKKIIPQEQNHQEATYTEKIKKSDGLVDLKDDAELNYRKFLAYHPWPGVYFFEDDRRIKITEAELKDLPAPSGARQAGGKFVIKRVIPEGKKEMDYEDFLRQLSR